MVTRSVYFVMLFGLWMLMTILSFAGKPKQQELNPDGTPKEAAITPPKPKVPMTGSQKMWMLLAIPVYLTWGFAEAHWAGIDLFAMEE